MANKKKPPWAFVVLAAIVGFVVLPVGICFAKVSQQERVYETARLSWERKFAVLVEDRATVEEVRQFIRSEGREVLENEADEKYGTRQSVFTEIPEVTYDVIHMRILYPTIYFDEEGIAVEYKVD